MCGSASHQHFSRPSSGPHVKLAPHFEQTFSLAVSGNTGSIMSSAGTKQSPCGNCRRRVRDDFFTVVRRGRRQPLLSASQAPNIVNTNTSTIPTMPTTLSMIVTPVHCK